MSGTGQSHTGAPKVLTPIAIDQPIGNTVDGKAVLPTFYFGQMIQRILAYLGQPVATRSTGSGGNPTIGEQLTALNNSVTQLEAASNSIFALTARVSGLESEIARLKAVLGARPDNAEDTPKIIATWGM